MEIKTQVEAIYEAQMTNLKTKFSDGEVITAEERVQLRDWSLLQWQNVQAQLESLKAQEMELRKFNVLVMSDPNRTKGTEHCDLGNGWDAKIVKKENIGFVKTQDGKLDKRAIDKALSLIEKDPNGEIIAERLVSWTPSLSLTEYNLLNERHKKAIDAVIVKTQGAPTLEIIPPKAPK